MFYFLKYLSYGLFLRVKSPCAFWACVDRQPHINSTYGSTSYVWSPEHFTKVNLIILIAIKNSRYNSYAYYTDEETEHREDKGLPQSHRVRRYWNQIHTQTVRPWYSPWPLRPHHLLPILQTPAAFQSLRGSCHRSAFAHVPFARRILLCWYISSLPSEPKCCMCRNSSLHPLYS